MNLRNRVLTFCNHAIYWEIIIIPFVASFSSAAVDIFIGLSLFTFILKRILGRKLDIAPVPLGIPFALLIVISLASFVNSTNVHSSIQGVLKLFKYGILLVVLSSEIKDAGHIRRIIVSIVFSLLNSSFDGIYQLANGVDLFRGNTYDFDIGLPRINAAFPHTNIYAGYLALYLPVSAALFLYLAKARMKLVLGIISLLGFFCLIFTFCRSALLGVWLALLFAVFVRKDKALAVFLIISVLAAPFLAPRTIRDWSKNTGSFAELALNKSRLVIFETSLNMVKHHPILGVGVNTFSINYPKYKLHDIETVSPDAQWYAHNSYLQMAGETGILALLVFLFIVFKLFSGWGKFYKKSKDDFLRVSSLGLAMGILAFLVHGMTETNLYYPKIATLFWYMAALLSAYFPLQKRGENG